MTPFDDEKNIFSDSGSTGDPWSADSLLEDSEKDIYSSSDHKVHSESFAENDSVVHSEPVKQESIADQKTVQKRKTKKPKKKKTFGRVLGKIALSLLLVIIITGSLVVGAIGIYITGFVDDEIDFDLNNLQLEYTSLVYAKDNKSGKWTEIANLHGTENRVWIDYSEFSPYLTDAIVAIEDKRFYDHEGVDWKRTFSAFLNMFVDLYGGTQGGSTITQQLVKNLTGDKEQTASRKVQEIVRARNLESQYAKSTIIECYINTVHFGNGCDGIETAASFYFGKDASQLTLLECASLAATIQTPSEKNPLDGPKANKERREVCLKEMLEQGSITKEEYDAAMKDTITVVADQSDDKKVKTKKVNSYFIDTLIEDVIDDLMAEKGCTYKEAENMIYSGGYRIYSSLNPSIQETLEETYADETNFPKNYKGKRAQSAQTIMDYNGHIVAIAGGIGEKKADRSLNRAYQSTRQPGSSIKPLSVYAPAIEYNVLTYSSLIQDYHIRLANGGYYPKASGSGGYVTTQRAIQSSLNSPAVRVCNTLTPAKSFEFLKKRFGISTIVESQKAEDGTIVSDITLSAMALGGMSHGVTVTEMTAAYATFGNLGLYYKPSTYYAIYDTFGDLVLQHQETGAQVISPETANVMNRLMQTVVTGGTGGAASLGGWPVFGKTGTTDDKHDCWFAGGTPYYVSVVWCGYDSSDDLPGGANPAPGIWRKTMSKVMEDLEKCDFNQAEGVVYQKYCTSTGNVATSGCTSTSYGYYKKSYLPACTSHGGTPVTGGSQPKPYGGKFAAIAQKPIPEANDWRNGTSDKANTSSDSSSKTTSE